MNDELEAFDSPEFAETSSFDEPAPTAPATPPAQKYKQQGFSIYTIMLILAFVCLLAGMILMFVEAGKYD
ncbi:MAG: hypothetical protein AAGA30_10235 [Planctomycetota bacterium]